MSRAGGSLSGLPEAQAAPSRDRLSGGGQLLVRNSVAIGASTAVSKALLFLWQLYLARALGAEGYGVYGTIGAMLAIGAAVVDPGLGLIVVREVAKRTEQAGRYLGATLFLQPLLAAVGYTGLTAAALLLGYDLQLRRLLALAAVSLLIDALGNMCHNQLLARERMQAPAVISVMHVALLIVLAGVALAAGGGLWGLYAATVVAGLFRAAVYWIVLYRTGYRVIFPPDRGLTRQLVLSGLPLGLMAFLSLASAHADKLMSTSLIGPGSTGYLTGAFVIVFGVVELLSTPMLVVTFPAMAKAFAGAEPERAQDLARRLAFLNLTVSLPLAVYTSMLATPLVGLLFGRDFAGTGDVLRILIWYAVVTMVTGVFAQVLTTQGRQARLLAIRTVGLTLNVGLSLALLASRGISGIALASLAAETLVLALLLATVHLPAKWWGPSIDRLWRLGLATSALAGLVLWLRGIHPLLAALAGIPAYIGLAVLSGAVTRADWRLLGEFAAAVPGGMTLRRIWDRSGG